MSITHLMANVRSAALRQIRDCGVITVKGDARSEAIYGALIDSGQIGCTLLPNGRWKLTHAALAVKAAA